MLVEKKTHFEQLRALCTTREQLNVICTAIKVLFNKKNFFHFTTVLCLIKLIVKVNANEIAKSEKENN